MPKAVVQKDLIIGFMFLYTAIFSVYAFLNSNFEFVYYTIIMIVLVLYVYKKQHSLWLSNGIVIGLALVGLLHLIGGGFQINGTRIYDVYLFGSLIRYDNFVHGVGSFVATFIGYNLIHPYAKKNILGKMPGFAFVLLLIALGIGAINEIVEFGAVLLFDAGARVGDFYNTGWDLVFNTIGSLVAISFISPFKDRNPLMMAWNKILKR